MSYMDFAFFRYVFKSISSGILEILTVIGGIYIVFVVLIGYMDIPVKITDYNKGIFVGLAFAYAFGVIFGRIQDILVRNDKEFIDTYENKSNDNSG